jgi:hypothetical protein
VPRGALALAAGCSHAGVVHRAGRCDAATTPTRDRVANIRVKVSKGRPTLCELTYPAHGATIDQNATNLSVGFSRRRDGQHRFVVDAMKREVLDRPRNDDARDQERDAAFVDVTLTPA